MLMSFCFVKCLFLLEKSPHEPGNSFIHVQQSKDSPEGGTICSQIGFQRSIALYY